jgi:RNA methyltransferase, TrmH family
VSELSKNKIKWLRSLHSKKSRDSENAYILEGEKMVLEAIHFKPEDLLFIAYTNEFIFPTLSNSIETIEVSEKELAQISTLKTPNKAFAVLKKSTLHSEINNGLIIALDNVQDPGNLGTILRIADWFGIDSIICSSDTVDCYNPKVVQASMGAILRIDVQYVDLFQTLNKFKGKIYGAVLGGKNMYTSELQNEGILLMGNEGKGISPEIQQLITDPISIPGFGHAESLNVSIATGILVAEFCRSKSLTK